MSREADPGMSREAVPNLAQIAKAQRMAREWKPN
jgi:hypothetical protein